MLRTVAVLLLEDIAVFEYGVVAEVFGLDRREDGVPKFDFRVCAQDPGAPMRTSSGGRIIADHGLDQVASADLVVVPATTIRDAYPAPVLDAIKAAAEAGSTLLTVCSGAFVLGMTGLLDGRRCTTHWRHVDEFRRRFPAAIVDADVLYVDEGDILSSAGTAAGIDACLHLVRRELGSTVATAIARRMVVPPQRDGGQRQFVELPIPASTADSLQSVLDWMTEHLTTEHTVAALAHRAKMSSRTFARRFVAETGTTPQRWLTMQRVLRARELLESTRMGIEEIARESGFGTAALLRHHFRQVLGVPPQHYRRTFAAD
ncbi:helix-turn-helix domain-containing protein [Actinopolymorpha sp. NPDC004070]|uniref:helix-turn-helix domain-containing protein n=1 Tax=Actinopolymorpha sp. NPDC004070 TaxID=3154548 RepID=UPI0033B02FD9